MISILVLHGPNLNLLGTREPGIYGHASLESINERLHDIAEELNVNLAAQQSNHEGVLLDAMHSSQDDAIVLNAGALDALFLCPPRCHCGHFDSGC